MSDLLKQLRAMPSSLNDACRTMEAAANEIERLQAAKRNALKVANGRSKENVLLRKALNEIADNNAMWSEMQPIARKALSQITGAVGTPAPTPVSQANRGAT